MTQEKKIHAPSVPKVFTDEDLEVKFNSLLYGWSRRFPLECVQFLDQVARDRRSILREDAMSVGGTMLWKASIPGGLFYAIQLNHEKLGLPKNWTDHPKFMPKFLECAKAFCINEVSVPKLHEDRKDIERYNEAPALRSETEDSSS
jgi:hypothetical protein